MHWRVAYDHGQPRERMAPGAEADNTMGRPKRHKPATEAKSTFASTLSLLAVASRAAPGTRAPAPPLTSSILGFFSERASFRPVAPERSRLDAAPASAEVLI